MEETDEVSLYDQQESHSLCFLYSLTDLGDRKCDLRILKCLVLIGHTIDNLSGIEHLCNLEELWVVDANLHLEDIEPLKRCTGLKQLYLYDNNLKTIPDFSSLNKLSCLWLSNNQITSLSNIDNMSSLKDMNLSDNNIKEFDIGVKTSTAIEILNLSGNPLHNLTDLVKLRNFKQLHSLVISDPLYRTSPVTLLANFRQYVIFVLPGLLSLDFQVIIDSQRRNAVDFYEQKIQCYRLKLNNSLAKLFNTYKKELKLSSERHELIWRALHFHGPQESLDAVKNSNFIFWQREAMIWRKMVEYNAVKQRQLEELMEKAVDLELEYSGNIAFDEVDLSEKTELERVKLLMDSYVCNHLKKVVEEIDLLNVWSISGTYQTTTKHLALGSLDENLFIWKPVQDVSSTPLGVVKEFIFHENAEENLELSKCLCNADPMVSCTTTVHEQLLSLSQTLSRSRLIIICNIFYLDQLTVLESPQICPDCQLMLLTEYSSMVPVYLVHFKYKFVDYFKQLRSSVSTDDPKGKVFLPRMIQHQTSTITTVVLKKAKIKSLDLPPMQSVTYLDLSYNLLESLASVSVSFPRVKHLNLAFNRIKRVDNVQRLLELNNLILKWNFISECVRTFKLLKDVHTLKRLNLINNPFKDVYTKEDELYFVCLHLSNLNSYNEEPMPRFLTSGKVVLQDGGKVPIVPFLDSPTQEPTILWRSNLVKKNEGNYLGTFNQILVSLRLRDLNLSTFISDLSLAKLKWLNLSLNLIPDLSILKGLPRLVEVDLSRNVIESVSCHDEAFKYLTRVNLSHNYITSLIHFKSQSFPNIKLLDLSYNKIASLRGIAQLKTLVELYVNHNSLKDRDTLCHCKSLKKLKVLDISFNPMTFDDNIREICLCCIGSLNYLNGLKVEADELKNAMVTFEGDLDIDYLFRIFSKPRLVNITNLSLPNCSIKKVQLPANSLVNVASVCLDNNKIASLDWIQFLPRVERISLSYNCICSYSTVENTFTSDSPLENYTLRSLTLDHNQIQNLVPLRLSLFPKLKLLVLNNNRISFLSGLNMNAYLENLILDRNRLAIIHPDLTRNLENLLELHLEHNLLTRIDFLKTLKGVQRLYLGHNKILSRSSLRPLTELTELRELTLHGNPLMRQADAYKEYLPCIPSLECLEGHNCTDSEYGVTKMKVAERIAALEAVLHE